MEKIKIIIADDHSVVTEGMRIILKNDSRFQLEGIYANANSVLNHLENRKVDIAILDLDMPGTENFSLLKEIKQKHTTCKVVIFTMHEGMYYFFEAIKHRADAYVLKSESITFMPTILMQTFKGFFYCSSEVKVHLSNDQETLKPIENEILDFLAQGMNYSEIGRLVNKSEKTIEYYIYKLRKKYNAQSNADLILQIKASLFK